MSGVFLFVAVVSDSKLPKTCDTKYAFSYKNESSVPAVFDCTTDAITLIDPATQESVGCISSKVHALMIASLLAGGYEPYAEIALQGEIENCVVVCLPSRR